MIAGLEEIDAGTIEIGAKVVNDVRPRNRDIAMVFQNYALYPHMTVAANMGFSLRMRGERPDVVSRKVREAAAMLGLEPVLDRLPRQLSGGQRQRVAMGRSMVRAPKVFLFDEPLSNLDAQLRVQMRAEIKELHRRLATTTVYVTHDQVEAMTMADRIVVLRDGKVEQIGAPLEVYDRPANLFVAGFIGSPAMNVLSGEVVAAGDGVGVRMPDGTTLQLGPRDDLRPGQPVRCGIRPEHVVLAAAGIGARIVTVEPTGSDTQVVLEIAGTRAIAVSRERLHAAPGEACAVRIDPSAIHVFDDKTGLRAG
jgi:multiple sugar transport system ATP-binding protein